MPIIVNPCKSGYKYKKDEALKGYPMTRAKLNWIWHYARDNYIDQGMHPHDAIIQTAKDLGQDPEEVLNVFAANKTFRQISNQQYLEMSRRRSAVQFAKSTLENMRTPVWQRAGNLLWQTPFALKVAGHFTVGMQTHAGQSLFRPSTWVYMSPNAKLFDPSTWAAQRTPQGKLMGYFPNFFDQFKYGFSRTRHEAAMGALMQRDNFALARRAGLANDPTHTYTDYGFFAKFLPKWLGRDAGQRGFDVLKQFRQDQFDHEWEQVSAEIKADPKASLEHAKEMAKIINHETGVIREGERGIIASLGTAKATQVAAFAARLEASRWQRVYGDPVRAGNIALRQLARQPVTDSERVFAKKVLTRAAEFAAIYYMGLQINNGLQKAAGSKNLINLNDPSRPDFLANKAGDHTMYLEGRVLAPIRLLARVIQAVRYPKPYEKREDPGVRAAKIAYYYGRGKLGPAPEVGFEYGTGRDFSGRPLPYSKERPSPGKPRLSGLEYASTFIPIPLEGMVRDMYATMRAKGMSHIQAMDFLQSLGTFGMETLGVGYYKTPEPRRRRATEIESFKGELEYRP